MINRMKNRYINEKAEKNTIIDEIMAIIKDKPVGVLLDIKNYLFDVYGGSPYIGLIEVWDDKKKAYPVKGIFSDVKHLERGLKRCANPNDVLDELITYCDSEEVINGLKFTKSLDYADVFNFPAFGGTFTICVLKKGKVKLR